MGAMFDKEIEDVKNYLAVIRMNTEYIRVEVSLPEDVNDALREIEHAVAKAGKVLAKAYGR